MNLGFKPHARHAQGFFHSFLGINDVFLRQHMENFLIGRDRHGLGRINHPINIQSKHFTITNRHDAM